MAQQAEHIQAVEGRTCWVCFGGDEDDSLAEWVKPCQCKGTGQWVHHPCLQRWIDEKQKGNINMKVSCPQCNTSYVIVFPKSNRFIVILDALDLIIQKSSPLMAAGMFIGSIYWTAVTYGALTVMQVLGHKEGLQVLEKADPLLLIIGLPAVPAGLILSRLVKWEDALLRLYRHCQKKVTGMLGRQLVFCGAILFPTFATTVGKLFFNNVQSNFQRTILGGITFVVLKGLLKLYLKQTRYTRQLDRKVMDYDCYLQAEHKESEQAEAETNGVQEE